MDADTLATCLRDGVTALSTGRNDEAVRLLGAVATDPDLASAPDLQDVRARVCSLLAQAFLAQEEPDAAAKWCRQALRLTRSLGDEDGRREVLELQRRILGAQTAVLQARSTEQRTQQTAATPLEMLLAGVGDAVERRRVMLAKANAEVDAGRSESGEPLARTVVSEADGAGDVRHQVLGRLALCRCQTTDIAGPLLLEAWQIASAADEFNLVGAVAKSAELHGVILDTMEGTWTSS